MYRLPETPTLPGEAPTSSPILGRPSATPGGSYTDVSRHRPDGLPECRTRATSVSPAKTAAITGGLVRLRSVKTTGEHEHAEGPRPTYRGWRVRLLRRVWRSRRGRSTTLVVCMR